MPAPVPPRIGVQGLLKQIKADVVGKEVQTGATYSYTWIADQVGHICIGLLLSLILPLIFDWVFGRVFGLAFGVTTSLWISAAVAILGVCTWEFLVYQDAATAATGLFPLDKTLLALNAAVASAYMVIGALIGLSLQLQLPITCRLLLVVGFLVIALALAPWWLLQKITWQKAGLPYLYRLADAQARSIKPPEADALQTLVDAACPPGPAPRQIVIAGTIGSGRTSLACAIGTELAFRRHTVRYVTMASLLEFAQSTNLTDVPPMFGDWSGPTNIDYWPWSAAQMLVIDDVGPMIDDGTGRSDAGRLSSLLNGPLRTVRSELGLRHTVWVTSNLAETGTSSLEAVAGGAVAGLEAVARLIGKFCGGQSPLAVRLEAVEAPPPILHASWQIWRAASRRKPLF